VNKGAIKPRALAAIVVFALSCFGLLLFLWLSFGGPVPLVPKGYRVHAQFTEATTLASEADVRISGVPVGKVKTVDADKHTGRSDVVMEIDTRYAPLPGDTRATLRQKTLLGETYVELTPGTKSAPTIPEGGSLHESAVADSVQLDEVFRAFDPRTREAFQTWMQEQSKAVGPYARDLNAALGTLGPFTEDAADLVGTLRRQQAALSGAVSGSADVFGALSERRGQLNSMIRNLATVFRTTGGRDRELREALVALPTFQREARATVQRLDRFATDTDPLVAQLRPAARELSPTLVDLKALAPDLRGLFADLNPLISASSTGFPAAQRLLADLRPFLRQVPPTLAELTPILRFIAPYKREITAFVANSVAATQAAALVGDRRVHYLRTTNPLHPQLLAAYPRRIGSNRSNPYPKPGAFAKLSDVPVFETRNCGRGDPVIDLTDPQALAELGQQAIGTIGSLLQPPAAGQQVPAPPCNDQGPFGFQGRSLWYPHVGREP
jgi:phospholipid/cholesterol/gamma-HCH transport system substrate-binding protein